MNMLPLYRRKAKNHIRHAYHPKLTGRAQAKSRLEGENAVTSLRTIV
jgi:hypothetical protein